MAKTDTAAPAKEEKPLEGTVIPASAPEEWVTVDEGAPTMVSLDTVGDVFVGRYIGMVEIVNPNDNETWKQYRFHMEDTHGGDFTVGELVGINGTYSLDSAMPKVPEGALVRLENMKEIPTKKGNPMHSYKVQYKK